VRDPWCAPENRFRNAENIRARGGTYRVRDIRTRPRLWWPSVRFSVPDWSPGACAVCDAPCWGATTYWYQFEEGRERFCRFCFEWAQAILELGHHGLLPSR
jgi:hypothetical protein